MLAIISWPPHACSHLPARSYSYTQISKFTCHQQHNWWTGKWGKHKTSMQKNGRNNQPCLYILRELCWRVLRTEELFTRWTGLEGMFPVVCPVPALVFRWEAKQLAPAITERYYRVSTASGSSGVAVVTEASSVPYPHWWRELTVALISQHVTRSVL